MIIGTFLMALAACAVNPEEESVLSKNDSIDDFIEVADLKEVNRFRYRDELQRQQLTNDYILIYDGADKSPHLIAFMGRCYNLDDDVVVPDRRYDMSSLAARADTYKGCRIRSLYELTPGQALELSELQVD